MSLKLNSSGGGSVTLQEPVTASNLTVNLPAANGTVVTADGSGNVAISGAANITGDANITGKLGAGGANYGTSGQVLMSQGASAAPVWGDAGSMTLLGTLTTTSGTSHTLSGLNLTPYKELFICFTNVSGNSGSTTPAGANSLRIDSILVQGPTANNYLSNGTIYLNLITGTFISSYWNAAAANDSNSAPSSAGPGTLYYGRTSYSTATTSLVFSLVSASFDNGSITVYGVK